MRDERKFIDLARQRFSDACEAERDIRREAQIDLDFLSGVGQWTAGNGQIDIKAAREAAERRMEDVSVCACASCVCGGRRGPSCSMEVTAALHICMQASHQPSTYASRCLASPAHMHAGVISDVI